jgi:Cu2+-exporting ATPase
MHKNHEDNSAKRTDASYEQKHHEDEHADHGHHVDHTGHEVLFRRKFWVCLVLSIPVLLFSPMLQSWLGFGMPRFTGSDFISPFFSIIVFLYGGLPFLQMAKPEIMDRKPGMMTLISLAITIAFLYSLAALFLKGSGTFFWELVTLIDVMLLGHWIEMRSIRQASGALDELAKLRPDTAERLSQDGEVEEIPIDRLNEGDRVLVRPGATIPADGIVEEGESDVNESMVTGESKYVRKAPESKVIGGTINQDGSLRVKITATGEETALAGIMRLVKQAQESKSKTQLLADRAAGWLFYIALGTAILTGIAWTIAIGLRVEIISRMATVLVIACPHALGLAIPLVIAITTGLGAQTGILVRDRVALEKARSVNTIIFDKTGTLTKGEFGVIGVATVKDWTEEKALMFAASAESDSEHTVARGILQAAKDRGLDPPRASDFSAIKGRGVKVTVENHTIHLGGPRLMEMLHAELTPDLEEFTSRGNDKGWTIIYLLQDEKPVAAFGLADVIRPESREAVQRIHDMGIKVSMVTGDSRAVAESVSKELGIDEFFAEVLPEHKDKKVVELQERGDLVAMVGDGINDAPALSRADVGIAIGGGTEVAVESAGIILVNDNPLDVSRVITLSRSSYRKMVQNLAWASGYNIVALPLAAGVLAPWGILPSPAIGAVFMSLSTVIVAINAQLLRRQEL